MRVLDEPCTAVTEPHLATACRLAERGRGTTSPNPLVGCVVVKDGRVVGEGYHERAGGPHAEVTALADAGEAARGATVFVTLEPCHHHGRTPPCTTALLEAGVAEVVVGMEDPNPDVGGGGAEALRQAGIRVRFADDPTPFQSQNEAWVKHVQTGLPWLQVKVALTLDGRPALAPGRPTGMSGEEARELAMRLRASSDAVAVGAGTLIADDPMLTVRDAEGRPAPHQPLRVVLCRHGIPSPRARLFDPEPGPSLALIPEHLASECEALEAGGVACKVYPDAGGTLSALRALGGLGLTRVLLEAGPGLFSAVWEERSVDEFVFVHAGGLGGVGAPSLYLGEGAESDGALVKSLRCVEAGTSGGDAVTVWRPTERSAAWEEGRASVHRSR